MQYCEDELLARAEECDDELALRRLEESEAWLQSRKAVVADEQARFDEEHRALTRLWYGID